jgi:hypothetical protein
MKPTARFIGIGSSNLATRLADVVAIAINEVIASRLSPPAGGLDGASRPPPIVVITPVR